MTVSFDVIPFVTVIVPTYNDSEDLARCIEALNKQSYPEECFEVIIANNNPANSPLRTFNFASNVRLIDVAAPGSYAARNAALAIAKGSVIAFTDADCTPEINWLVEGVKALQKGADRVAGRVQLYFNSEKQTAAELYEKAFAFRQEENVSNGISVTANLFVWRKLFEQIGKFDSSLMSGGDVAWNRVATNKGWSLVYEDKAVVYHAARSSIGELKKKKKRVMGGSVVIDGLSGIRVIKGLMPPINTIKYLRQRRDLSYKDKFFSFFVLYFLKVYGVYVATRVKLGLEINTRS